MFKYSNVRGFKQYELINHLGNVLATVSDKRLPVQTATPGLVDYYTADVKSVTDYYPFGMEMPGRSISSTGYKYGFSGALKDDEVLNNSGSGYNFGSRVYNPLIGRWFKPDPEAFRGPQLSPYSFCFNSPLVYKENDGNWPEPVHTAILTAYFKPLVQKGIISYEDLANIIEGSKRADTKQKESDSHIHYMLQPGITLQKFEELKNDWITGKITEAKKKLYGSEVDRSEAFKLIGEAVHPLMDKTCPEHTKNVDGEYVPRLNDLGWDPAKWAVHGRENLSSVTNLTEIANAMGILKAFMNAQDFTTIIPGTPVITDVESLERMPVKPPTVGSPAPQNPPMKTIPPQPPKPSKPDIYYNNDGQPLPTVINN